MGEHRKPDPEPPKRRGPGKDHYVEGWKAGLMYARYLMANSATFAEARVKVDLALQTKG